MSEKTSKREDEILDEAIRYVIAASKGQTYKYPEGWDMNIKRSDRKRDDQVTVIAWRWCTRRRTKKKFE